MSFFILTRLRLVSVKHEIAYTTSRKTRGNRSYVSISSPQLELKQTELPARSTILDARKPQCRLPYPTIPAPQRLPNLLCQKLKNRRPRHHKGNYRRQTKRRRASPLKQGRHSLKKSAKKPSICPKNPAAPSSMPHP